MKNYYEEPTQVIFITPEINDEPPLCGIAYRDEIICAECGAIIEMADAIILEQLSWISFNDEIGGSEFMEKWKNLKTLNVFISEEDLIDERN